MIFSKFECPLSGWPHWHCVGVVIDFADTFRKLWSLLIALKGTIRQKKLIGGIYTTNSNNSKIWKSPYLKKKLHVCEVSDCSDTRFSNFATEYFRENKKGCKTKPVHMWPRSNLFSKEKMVENLVTLSLTGTIWVERWKINPQ